MNRLPKWAIWAALTVALWVVWGMTIRSSFVDREVRLVQEQGELESKTASTIRFLDGMPAIVAQLDSLDRKFLEETRSFPSLDGLESWLGRFVNSASQGGIKGVSVTPVTESLIDLPSTLPSAELGCQLPRQLQLDLSAVGQFKTVGRWLDELEKRADFVEWESCRWESAQDGDLTRFSGRAVFWLIEEHYVSKDNRT